MCAPGFDPKRYLLGCLTAGVLAAILKVANADVYCVLLAIPLPPHSRAMLAPNFFLSFSFFGSNVWLTYLKN